MGKFLLLLISGLAILLALTGNASAQMEMFFLTGILCMICPIIWLIIFILIAVWVYKDANSRGMSGVLWLLIVIILGIIGIIIYLIVRRSHPVGGGAPPPGAYPPPPPPGYPPQQPPPPR